MASEKQYKGDAAVFAAISQFLMRGYNHAKPLYDEDDSDDFWIKDSQGKIRRCQAKSSGYEKSGCKFNKKTQNWKNNLGYQECSGGMQFPESITTGGVDYVIMCLNYKGQFFVGIFDHNDVNELQKKGLVSKTGRKTKNGKQTHRDTLGFRWSIDRSGDMPKIFLNKSKNNKFDITYNFQERRGKWDILFPSKFDFGNTCWDLYDADNSIISRLTLNHDGSIESSKFLDSKWRLDSGSNKTKNPKRLILRLSEFFDREIEFTYHNSLDQKLMMYSPGNRPSYCLARCK